jgi:hypothetical protein
MVDRESGPVRRDDARRDWLLPAAVVGVAVGVVVVIVFTLALVRTSQPETPIEQVAAWTACLRREGADVPLIESLPDGGVRVTIEGSILDGDLDPRAYVSAFRACADAMPEALTDLLDRLGGAGSWQGGETSTRSAMGG